MEKVYNVGSKEVQIPDEEQGLEFPALIHYPTLAEPALTAFGPYKMNVAVDAAPAMGSFPLIAISHGSGGSHLLYRTYSTYLAERGFVVIMPEHPGNNRNNNSLAETETNFLNRPRHVKLTLDFIRRHPAFSAQIDGNRIGMIGHSMGGYTALALAGGIPWSREGKMLSVAKEPDLKGLVLMAPGTGCFNAPGALDELKAAVLMYSAEQDPYTPAYNAEIVLNRVPAATRVTAKTIPNSGHFSFLAPFPEAMQKPGFLPATDSPGFDRQAIHRELQQEIYTFFQTVFVSVGNK